MVARIQLLQSFACIAEANASAEIKNKMSEEEHLRAICEVEYKIGFMQVHGIVRLSAVRSMHIIT